MSAAEALILLVTGSIVFVLLGSTLPPLAIWLLSPWRKKVAALPVVWAAWMVPFGYLLVTAMR